MFKFNPNQAEASASPKKYSAWEPGQYEGIIEAVEEKKSKAGNDMLEITFKFFDGNRKQKVWWYIPSNAGWLIEKLGKFVESMGIPGFDSGNLDPDQIPIGQAVKANLIVEEYNGKESNKIQDVWATQTSTVPADDIPF